MNAPAFLTYGSPCWLKNIMLLCFANASLLHCPPLSQHQSNILDLLIWKIWSSMKKLVYILVY